MFDCHDSRLKECWSTEIGCEVVDLSCSPEGSIVAVACRDQIVRAFDVTKHSGEVQFALYDPAIEATSHVRVFPEHFCLLTYGKDQRRIWDLITGAILDRFPSDCREMRHVLTHPDYGPPLPEDKPIHIGFGQFVTWNVDERSANGRIAVDCDRIYIDGKGFDEPQSRFFNRTNDYKWEYFRLVADGRVIWAQGRSIIGGLDLMAVEVNERSDSKLPMWDRGRWEENVYLSDRHSPEGWGNDASWLSYFLYTCPPVTDQPAFASEQVIARSPDDFISSRMFTPDGRIAINVHWGDGDSDEVEPDILYRSDESEGITIKFVQVSPCGQRSFVSHNSGWYVWDIARGKTIAANKHKHSRLSSVLPDWTCVVSIDDGRLSFFDVWTGAEFQQAKLVLDATGAPRAIQVSPEGRCIIVSTSDGVSVWSIAKGKVACLFHISGVTRPIITPDGKSLVTFRGQSIEINELSTGLLRLSQPCLNDPTTRDMAFIALDGTIVVSDWHGEFQLQWTLRNATNGDQFGTPIVTPTRVFRYDADLAKHQNAVKEGNPLPGGPDPHLTCICLHCGKRSIIPETAEQTLDDIRVSANKSPCLHLPDEAWDQPELLIACQHCEGPLQLNPFVVS